MQWLCICLLAVVPRVQAAAPAVVPEFNGLVVDQTGLLTSEVHAALTTRLQDIQQSGRAQVAILVASGIKGESLAEYSLRVAEAWRLGRAGRDDGLLILVVPSINAARIETGYGLEGHIPDALASRWVDQLLPAIKNRTLGPALDQLLNDIDNALPVQAAQESNGGDDFLFPGHPEWRLPFVLVVFSFFSVVPLLLGRWGRFVSAFMLAAFYGGAAWALWDSRNAGLIAAAIAFPLPLMWSLNWDNHDQLARGWRIVKTFGNLCALLMFFSILTLFVGVGFWAGRADEIWAAPVFSGVLSLGLAVYLFPQVQMPLMILLRTVVHFVIALLVVYLGLLAFVPQPVGIAFGVAGVFTALIATGLFLDQRAAARGDAPSGSARTSKWLFGIALLMALPFGLLLLVQAALGEDLQTSFQQAAAGGGSIGGIVWWMVRHGLFGAAKIGLGGLFGGGGAGRGG